MKSYHDIEIEIQTLDNTIGIYASNRDKEQERERELAAEVTEVRNKLDGNMEQIDRHVRELGPGGKKWLASLDPGTARELEKYRRRRKRMEKQK